MEKNIKKNTKKSIKPTTPDLEETILVDTNEIINKSIDDILNEYVKNYIQFKLFFKNTLIFDTKTLLRKNYPVFGKTGFSIGENKYIYKGIRVELY